MQLFVSSNTCSMGEVGHLSEVEQGCSDDLATDLASIVSQARSQSRKFLVANLSPSQQANKPLITALKKHKFVKVGKYRGNSECDVHVYVRGLKSVKEIK